MTTLSQCMTNLNTAIAAVPTFVGAQPSTINPVLASLYAAIQCVNALILTTDVVLNATTTLGNIKPSVLDAVNVASFNSTYAATMNQQQYLLLLGFLQRMQTNLTLINSSGRTITVSGGNLFDIASREYGDGTAWTQIAAANGLTDPQLVGNITLIIPPYNASGTNGVLTH